MADDRVQVLSVERLEEPPSGRPSGDRVWWEVVVASDAGQHTIHAWVSESDVVRLPEDERDTWVKGAVEDKGVYHGLDGLLAMQPLPLRVPSDP